MASSSPAGLARDVTRSPPAPRSRCMAMAATSAWPPAIPDEHIQFHSRRHQMAPHRQSRRTGAAVRLRYRPRAPARARGFRLHRHHPDLYRLRRPDQRRRHGTGTRAVEGGSGARLRRGVYRTATDRRSDLRRLLCFCPVACRGFRQSSLHRSHPGLGGQFPAPAVRQHAGERAAPGHALQGALADRPGGGHPDRRGQHRTRDGGRRAVEPDPFRHPGQPDHPRHARPRKRPPPPPVPRLLGGATLRRLWCQGIPQRSGLLFHQAGEQHDHQPRRRPVCGRSFQQGREPRLAPVLDRQCLGV